MSVSPKPAPVGIGVSSMLSMAKENGSADSSISHRLTRLEGIVEQLTLGDVPSLHESQNQLKQRMDTLEIRNEVQTQQRLDQAATMLAELAAQAVGKLGADVSNQVQKSYTEPDLSQVQTMLDDSLRAARAEWKAEIELQMKRADSVQELGRVLVQEFEQTIVDIVEKGVADARQQANMVSCDDFSKDQARRLSAVEGKLGKICDKITKMQDAADVISLGSRSDRNVSKDERQIQEMSDTVVRIGLLSETSQLTNAALQADVVALRTELQRLVSVDFHALQMQTEAMQMQIKDVVKQTTAAVKTEVQVRLEEDRRIEGFCKEKFSELINAFRDQYPLEISALGRKVSQILSEGDDRTQTPSEGTNSAPSASPRPAKASRNSGSDDRSHSPRGRITAECGGDPSNMVEDLRDTILTYFRSEFQEHVAKTLHKLQPEPSGRLQIGQLMHAHEAQLRARSPGTAPPLSARASLQSSVRHSTPSGRVVSPRQSPGLVSRELLGGGSVSSGKGSPVQAVPAWASDIGPSMGAGVKIQAVQSARGSSQVVAAAPDTPRDVALTAFENKRAMFEAKTQKKDWHFPFAAPKERRTSSPMGSVTASATGMAAGRLTHGASSSSPCISPQTPPSILNLKQLLISNPGRSSMPAAMPQGRVRPSIMQSASVPGNL